MEDVDSIILHFLKKLKINIDDEVKSLCDLPVEKIIESASRCLTTINKSVKVSTKALSGVSQKIEVATQIASICKDLGYKNDVGYQTFLYYNEADLRQVFMFLIERLPNESNETSLQPVSDEKKSLLLQHIGCKIKEELKTIWIPPCCTTPNKEFAGDFITTKVTSGSNKVLIKDKIIIAKLLDMMSQKSDTQKKYVESVESATESEVKEKINDIMQDKSVKDLKETAIILKQKLDVYENEKNIMEVEYSQVRRSYNKAEAELNSVKEIVKDIQISNDGSEDSKDVIDELKKHIMALETQNEKFITKIISLKHKIDKKMNTTVAECEKSKCKLIIKELKETAKAMKTEYEDKQVSKQQLTKAYEKLMKENKRSNYIKRILEIISNVDKQNMEIKKILDDTRQLQKEINLLEGQLDRCFSISDETLYKDAKKDDQAKKAYKLLALLHSECNSIVSLVNDTGTLQREIVDLEDNIELEKAKKTEETLKRILFDHSQLQEEYKEV